MHQTLIVWEAERKEEERKEGEDCEKKTEEIYIEKERERERKRGEWGGRQADKQTDIDRKR